MASVATPATHSHSHILLQVYAEQWANKFFPAQKAPRARFIRKEFSHFPFSLFTFLEQIQFELLSGSVKVFLELPQGKLHLIVRVVELVMLY